MTRCAAMLDDRDIERPRLVALVEAGDWTHRRSAYSSRRSASVIHDPGTDHGGARATSDTFGQDSSRSSATPDRRYRLRSSARTAPETRWRPTWVGIWEEVLGVSPIGVTDDFFELGGHSLLAVRMMDQIGKVLRQSLPIALLFQAPTVEGVADRIREMEEEPRHANAWETVVPIQKGGDRVPFFCIHDGAGGVFHFNYLARQMGRDLPFYGLQPQAWDFGRAGAPTIEGMAQHYIDAIRSVQAHGPFMIGGFCFGGIVALEVAQRLKAAGEEVGVLALIEPSRIAGGRGDDEPGAPAGSAASGRFARLKSKVKSKFVYAHGAELIDPDKVGTYRSPLEVVKLFRVALQVRFKRLVCRAYLLAGRPIPRRYRNFYFKTEVSRRAGIRYKARPYDGTIDLFLARRHGLDWERLATGGTTIHKVPADETGHTPDPSRDAARPLDRTRCPTPASSDRHGIGRWAPRSLTPTGSRWVAGRRSRIRAEVRLFCFPHAGGGASAYHQWPDLLPEWVDVAPVQPPGREQRIAEPPIDDLARLIEALAGGLADQIETPYAFFGHSLGALVAYELARAAYQPGSTRTDRPLRFGGPTP